LLRYPQDQSLQHSHHLVLGQNLLLEPWLRLSVGELVEAVVAPALLVLMVAVVLVLVATVGLYTLLVT
tara:strand:+ start:7 stop:210 length:204 start_codon:yes stop_codon:yes gene_type:complete